MEWVFSYGLSTDPEQMHADVGSWHKEEEAQLHGYAYMFTGYHPEFKGGTSTIVAQPGAETLGVAYLLDDTQLETLDQNGHGYEPRGRRIELRDGEVNAVTFEPPTLASPRAPSATYLDRVRLGLSQHYHPKIVTRYLQHALKRSSGDINVHRRLATSDSFRHEFGVAFRRLFPWEVTESGAFGSGWAILGPDEETTPHSHDEEECFIIVSGEGCMTIDGRELPVAKADTIYIEPFSAHSVRNVCPEPLEVLCLWWGAAEPAQTS